MPYEIEKTPGYYDLLQRLKFNDTIVYRKASLDARYRDAENREEPGPYQGKIVDFPDSPGSNVIVTEYSRVGVRDDGFHGTAPLYYVRLGDIIKLGGLTVRESGRCLDLITQLSPNARLNSTPELWRTIQRHVHDMTIEQACTLIIEAGYQDKDAELSGDGQLISIYAGGLWFPWPVFTVQYPSS